MKISELSEKLSHQSDSIRKEAEEVLVELLAATESASSRWDEDAAQEAVWRILHSGSEYRAPAALRSLLRTAALQAGTRDASKRARSLLLEPSTFNEIEHATSNSAWIELAKKELIGIVRHALTKLGDRDQEVARLFFYEQLDTQAVAAELGVSVCNAYTLKSRMLDRLRPILQRHQVDSAQIDS